MTRLLWSAALVAAAATATVTSATGTTPTPLPHSFEPLDFVPKVVKPTNFTLIDQTKDQRSALYEIVLDKQDQYSEGPVLMAVLEGTPTEVGEAFGKLLGQRTVHLYKTWVGSKFPNALEMDAVAVLLDWLWDEGLAKFAPQEFLDELKGIETSGKAQGIHNLQKLATRIVTLSNLPADTQNIEKVIRDLILHGPEGAATRLRDHCGQLCSGGDPTKEQNERLSQTAAELIRPPSKNKELHGPGFCDFFAVWGEHTEDGRLLSSRNLDFDRDINETTGKLVTVVRYTGDDSVPYATMGFPGYWGALAGMSAAGITVSEANLDNADVSFRGIAWPLRLRQILGSATSLADARSMWAKAPNTGAFNFLVASAIDVNSTSATNASLTRAAVAIEGTFKNSNEAFGADAFEDSATFQCNCKVVNASSTPPQCVNGTVSDGVECRWPYSPDVVSIGASLPNAVFRSNHGLHPLTMATQEPLWNDTVMRYFMLHDSIETISNSPGKMSALGAVNTTAYLGIKVR